MKKIFTLLILLLLLPVTALAAGNDRPHSLYVGNTNFASTIYPDNAAYWTSSDGGTNWTSQLEKPTGDSYIHYNGQGTLTLHNANIQGQYDSSNRYSGYGIYAVGAPGNAVSLTIKLEGTNTVSGWSGIFVHAVDGAASLSISGTGSLATEGTGGISFSGIVVQGNGGKAELTINNVDVTATNTSDSAQGILLQSADSSPATLTVNGGELTASGQRAGIKYVFGSSGTGDGTPTVTVSGNAIVRANGGISDDSSTDIQIGADSNESNGGIVFDGKNGTVYGDVTLQEDITIGEGESLTIGQDASLNTGSHEVIVNGGTLIGEVNDQQSPQITTQPQNKTVTEGESATFTIEASGSEPLSYQWQASTDSGSNWKSIAGATSTSYEIVTTNTDMSDHQYRCVVTASGVSVVSDAATLTVTAKPTYTITAVSSPAEGGTVSGSGSYTEGTSVTLTATANSGYRFVGWMENGQQVSADATYTFTANSNHTLTAKFEQVYTVTVSPVEGGTATADKAMAAAGETITLTATPSSGYYFVEWKVVSGTVSIQNNKFTMPAENVEVQAVFGLSVTSITLDKTELSLYTGDSETLTATIEPDNATNQAVTWESSDPNVATVDENGKVTAVAAGKAIITATTADGGKTATCQVKVTQSTYSITADITTLDFGSVYIGYTRPTAQTVTITNTGNRPQTLDQPTSTTNFVVGTLSKMELAAGEGATFTVQPKAGLAVGTYSENITVSSSEGATVTIPTSFTVLGVTNIIINKSELILYIGDNETLTATIEPIEAAGQTVTWKSSNETIATVDANGKVTAVYAGEATITATVGDKTAICEVKVRKPAEVGSTSSTNLSFTTDRDEFALTAIVYGENLDRDKAKWTWSVADADVVALSGSPTWRSQSYSISRQAFTIKGTGTTTITATYDDGIYRGLVNFTVRISKPTPPDPISYYNIYIEDVCDGVEVSTSKNVVREGGSVSVYVKKDTVNYTFDNFKVYYKRSYYGGWEELKEGTQPGEYPIKNIWNHIYIKALGAEEKETPTGIESIEGVKVYTKDGSLYVQTPQREQVIIDSMSGAVVKNEEQVGLKQYHGLQPGIYIVRVGDKAYKLRLY